MRTSGRSDGRTDARGVTTALERTLTLDPRNAETLNWTGFFFRALGQDSASRAAYFRSLAIEPERPDAEVALRLGGADSTPAEALLAMADAQAGDTTTGLAQLRDALGAPRDTTRQLDPEADRFRRLVEESRPPSAPQ